MRSYLTQFLFLPLWIMALLTAMDAASQNAVPFTRIAIAGCHNQHDPAPSLEYMANTLQPHYTIWVGDNVYADTETDPAHIRRQLEILEAKPGFEKLRSTSEFLVTWDDHDYGLNNAGSEYPHKAASLQIHKEFWHLEAVVPEGQDGIYNSRIDLLPNGKRIQFIMLDGRYNRVKGRRSGDALGENQWEWLDEQLHQEADLRFIVSGYQVLLNRPNYWESWVKYGKSRKRLFKLIKDHETKGVVFITGDQHYVEVLKRGQSLGYDTYEIMAAGINKNEMPGGTGLRVAGPDVTIHSAPFIDIHWNADVPYLQFSNIDVQKGEMSLQYRILLKDIGL